MEKPKQGAPKGNQNAAKSEDEALSSRIWINVTREEKARIVRAAGGRKVTEWGREILLEASPPLDQE